MIKPNFIYVTYVATTAEKVWEALVNTDITRQYWVDPNAGVRHFNVSDWKTGSGWEMQSADDGLVKMVGRVIESKAPHRLVMTWGRASEAADTSKHSSVSFDIEPYVDGTIRLTVKHWDLDSDPQMLEGISSGWPTVLSNLKTLLETGRALPYSPKHHIASI